MILGGARACPGRRRARRLCSCAVGDLRGRTNSDFRRMLRDERQSQNLSIDRSHIRDSGWRRRDVVVWGTQLLEKKKLESYIEAHAYNSSFFTDHQRLERLQRNGIGYYELAGQSLDPSGSFDCVADQVIYLGSLYNIATTYRSCLAVQDVRRRRRTKRGCKPTSRVPNSSPRGSSF